ncbi:amino acid transporter [Hydrogenophaga palleronii]|uniref:Amino acid transporter n=1 Tax=Hydrogenophaga palleronii TaxID=65655 RepID=A0ABU1WTR5_9BURK|nr:hypothetical protein [Hydrogenophaga palleronii]MDR7152469.1 amino acid transporter [Hydrogenophaga palleronii]
MSEVFAELSRPVWWVSVVAAGIAINLLSSYLKGAVDGVFSSTSSWWRRRSSARQRAWASRVERLASSEKERNWAAASEVRNRLQSIHLLLLSMIAILLPAFANTSGFVFSNIAYFFVLGFSSIIFFMSFLAFRQAAETAAVLRAAGRKEGLIDTDDALATRD